MDEILLEDFFVSIVNLFLNILFDGKRYVKFVIFLKSKFSL